MRFRISLIHSNSYQHAVFMSESSAAALGIFFGDVVEIRQGVCKIQAIALESNLPNNQVGLTRYFIHSTSLDLEKDLDIFPEKKMDSISFILKKLRGLPLSKNEIDEIVEDIGRQALSEAAISYFVAAVAKKGLSISETQYLTDAMANSGDRLHWDKKIVADKHCVGGIPGNRTTPIVVAICAAAGLLMPKTSSRAITSAAGTADMMEVLTHVALSTSRIKEVVQSVGACLVWGGSLGLAPADDVLIHVERQIELDPKQQIVASILSKKISAGSTHVLIDIPCGKGAKVSTKEARELASLFEKVAAHFNLKIKTILTDGTKPIGRGLGPVLEALDVLAVLERKKAPKDLETKSVFLAGQLLELTGHCKKGQGSRTAQQILDSGEALKKFNQIIIAQGRKNSTLEPGPFSLDIFATSSKKISWNNQELNHLARVLGCPEKSRAGVLLHIPSGLAPKAEKPILTLYAESQAALNDAQEFARTNNLFTFC